MKQNIFKRATDAAAARADFINTTESLDIIKQPCTHFISNAQLIYHLSVNRLQGFVRGVSGFAAK